MATSIGPLGLLLKFTDLNRNLAERERVSDRATDEPGKEISLIGKPTRRGVDLKVGEEHVYFEFCSLVQVLHWASQLQWPDS